MYKKLDEYMNKKGMKSVKREVAKKDFKNMTRAEKDELLYLLLKNKGYIE